MKMKRPLEAVIEEVIVEPSKIQPILVNFQNGDLKEEEAKNMSCGVFYDQKSNKTVLAMSNDQVVYKGYKPDTSNELTCTMLVLHNKKTGKVKLIQAERWQVSAVLQKPEVDDNKIESEERHAMVNKEFGSKKAKRRTEQYERLKVDVESVKEQLEKTVSGVEIDKLELSTQIQEDEFITNTTLPQCNREATNVKDVYDIYDIVPASKLETLYDRAMEVLKGETEEKTKFFIRTLKYLQNDADSVKKAALLIYIQALCTWLNLPIKDAKKRGQLVCPWSEEVNTYVIENYSVASGHGRLRPNSMRDKGILHCMILALIVSNYELDLEQFATMLNNRSMGMKKLTVLARVIGALPHKDDKKIVFLKVPLPAPLSVVRKGKQKQR